MVIKELFCLRCGYIWFPRIFSRPISCPGCKSRAWDEDRGSDNKERREFDERRATPVESGGRPL